MFGKLLKYEFKAVGKWYLGLYAAAISLSVIIGFWLQDFTTRPASSLTGVTSASTVEGVLLIAILSSFAIILVGLLLSTLFLIVNRFRKNVYGRQGYLTMTLPVTNHQIILSKLTAGFIWSLLSSIATIICLLIIFSITIAPVMNEVTGEMLQEMSKAFQQLAETNLIFYYAVGLIADTVNSILLIYFAISLGQLFKDHRTLLAIVFYFAINFAQGIFSFIILLSMGGDAYTPLNTYSLFTISLSILLSIGYYFGTYYIMSNRLNLQ
ncbi:hypothetical protein BVE84_04685 [Streptococcus azizii]|uniref:ABC transporter permease n=1 Tax=Streptococcus azizii TaxID=1579424 RepID=A0AB36JMJ6_9STRE|nr:MULTISPECIES: hypothetical protein [Streptococcus]MBF0776790.1 ABC transporter permease [Streptococcus sp. 19428wD3_AN2]ONK27521.1 hypothetical protein BVE85_06250 [Streptococcus azizii]ONK27642.1 hypothetical protein BVE86_04525 [Streptococcus azizii]ONK29822.1 hypothetical protein BVE84_04685 [Streptococcus azizii]TFU82371.1 ABC transporter permease [Streptococcus sp. AN2]